jgi:tetratricopeptide (TPR) repeat protein
MKRKAAPAVIPLLLGALVVALSFYKLRDPDLWLYVKTGDLILSSHHIPLADPFSYTRPGAPWLNHSWLSEVVFSLAWRAGGTAGLFLVRWLLLLGTFALLYFSIRRQAGETIAAVLTALSILAASPRFVVRPELFTFFFLALLLALLDRAAEKRRSLLFLLPPLFLIWANCHGGFVIGLGVLILAVAGKAASRLPGFPRPTGFPGRAQLRSLLIAGALACLAALANPLGLKAFTYYREIREVSRHIYAWQPVSFLQPASLTFAQYVFLALVLLTLAAFFARRRSPDPAALLFFGVFTILAFSAARNLALCSLVLPFVCARTLADAPFRPALDRVPRAATAASLAALLVVLTLYPGWERDPFQGDIHRETGFGISPLSYPFPVADFISRHRLPGPMFNTFGVGSTLSSALWPERKVYVDGRLPVYGDDFLRDYNRLLIDNGSFDREARRRMFGFAVVGHLNPSNVSLLEYLAASGDWTLAFFDGAAALFLPAGAAGAGELARRGMEEALSAEPSSPQEAFSKGRFLLLADRPSDSLRYFETLARSHPASVSVQAKLAQALAETGRWEEARQALVRAVAGSRVGPDLALTLADSYFANRDFREAARWYSRVTADHGEYERARVYLAGCLARSGQTDRARETYESCAAGGSSYAQICFYNLARLDMEEGRQAEARSWFKKIEDPALRKKAAQDPVLGKINSDQ